ncbi:MAG: DUF6157 family protein [Treponema sp.]|jgi:hypothetical protein|nr:DUF6157 family protein [Treponema sp.]
MKIFTTNYQNSFMEIADDCPAEKGEIPPVKKTGKTIACIQYDMLHNNPYKYTSDEILFQCYAIKQKIQKKILTKLRGQFFSKGQACFRASPLTKLYGWGIHYDNEGKMALYGCETKEYKAFSKDKKLKLLKAVRSKNNTPTADELETPKNLAEKFNSDKSAYDVFTKMRASCQKRYITRANQIKDTPNESSKMDTIIREIIRYGKNHVKTP